MMLYSTAHESPSVELRIPHILRPALACPLKNTNRITVISHQYHCEPPLAVCMTNNNGFQRCCNLLKRVLQQGEKEEVKCCAGAHISSAFRVAHHEAEGLVRLAAPRFEPFFGHRQKEKCGLHPQSPEAKKKRGIFRRRRKMYSQHTKCVVNIQNV